MIDALLIFTGGLLGSSHCVGMCGGFVLSLGSAGGRWRANLLRQVVYALGRVFTYTTAGAMAGYAGWRLEAEARTVVNVQAVLSIVAGLFLVFQGLVSTGVLRPQYRASGRPACLGPTLFGALLRATRLRSVFLGGVINGLLPCGLVYAYLALAGSTGSLGVGAATMALFGLGTLPLMVLTGCGGGSLLGLAGRRHLVTVAGWCVTLTGVLTVLRGCGFLPFFFTLAPAPSCPLCGPE